VSPVWQGYEISEQRLFFCTELTDHKTLYTLRQNCLTLYNHTQKKEIKQKHKTEEENVEEGNKTTRRWRTRKKSRMATKYNKSFYCFVCQCIAMNINCR
jgi:hypothetical protein